MRSWIWKGLTAYVQLLVFFLGAQAGDGFWEIPDENGAQCGNMAATWKGRCASDLYTPTNNLEEILLTTGLQS